MTIRLVYHAPLHRSDVEPLAAALATFDADVAVAEGKDPGPQAALEWALPVAIAISGPILGGFLGEAGKDAYEALKRAVSRLIQRTRENPVKWRSANGEDKAQPPLAMQFPLEGREIKFVFPHSLTPDEAVQALEKLKDTLAFVTQMVTWQKEQFTLLDQHVDELYGQGFPTDTAEADRWQLLGEIAFGTWVFVGPAQRWIKVA